MSKQKTANDQEPAITTTTTTTTTTVAAIECVECVERGKEARRYPSPYIGPSLSSLCLSFLANDHSPPHWAGKRSSVVPLLVYFLTSSPSLSFTLYFPASLLLPYFLLPPLRPSRTTFTFTFLHASFPLPVAIPFILFFIFYFLFFHLSCLSPVTHHLLSLSPITCNGNASCAFITLPLYHSMPPWVLSPPPWANVHL
ncbi:hypothetical protein EDD21DRAFT_71765 [Dissophora ornata]|nr:hypothetical protein EDD21DRAFT_71765 [Dissophora ornata]